MPAGPDQLTLASRHGAQRLQLQLDDCLRQATEAHPVAEVVLARAVVSLVLSWWLLKRQQINPGEPQTHLDLARRGGHRRPVLCTPPLPSCRWPQQQCCSTSATTPLPWLGVRLRTDPNILIAMALGWSGVLLVAQPGFASAQESQQHTAAAGGGRHYRSLLTSLYVLAFLTWPPMNTHW